MIDVSVVHPSGDCRHAGPVGKVGRMHQDDRDRQPDETTTHDGAQTAHQAVVRMLANPRRTRRA